MPAPSPWVSRACREFGEPWLGLVLRAGQAAQSARGAEHEVTLIRDSAIYVWETATEGQAAHRRIAGMRVPAEADRLGAVVRQTYAELEDLVAKIEVHVEQNTVDDARDRARQQSSRADSLTLALAATRTARADLEALEAMPPLPTLDSL